MALNRVRIADVADSLGLSTATVSKLAKNGIVACSLQRSHEDKILLTAIGI